MKKLVAGLVFVAAVVLVPQTASAQWWSGVVNFVTGSSDEVVLRLEATSPATRTLEISSTEPTEIVLGIWGVKSNSIDTTLKKIDLVVESDNPSHVLYSSVNVTVGGKTFSNNPTSSSGGSYFLSFGDLSVNLTPNTYETIRVTAVVKPNAHGVFSNTSTRVLMYKKNLLVQDKKGNIVENRFAFIPSNSITFATKEIPVLSNYTATSQVQDNGTKTPIIANVNFGYTVSNLGDRNIYISKENSIALGTSNVGGAVTSSLPSSNTVVSPASVNGDTTSAYIIPPGVSRVFKHAGRIDNRNGVKAFFAMKIDKIYYGFDTANLRSHYLQEGKLQIGRMLTPAVELGDGDGTSQPGVFVTSISATNVPVEEGTNTPDSSIFAFNFTLYNSGVADIYIEKTAVRAFVLSTQANATVTPVFLEVTPASVNGDTVSVYIIPAGTSRKVSLTGKMENIASTSALFSTKIDKIKYGFTSSFAYSTYVTHRELVTPAVSLAGSGAGISSPVVSNTSAIAVANDNGTNAPVSATVTFKATITAPNTDIIVSRNASRALATTTSGGAAGSLTSVFTVTSPATVNGDTPDAYIIPAGSSRSFVYSGVLDNSRGISQLINMSILKFNYGPNGGDSSSKSIEKTITTPAVSLGGSGTSQSRATVTNASAIAVVNDNGTNAPVSANVTFKFTMTAAGNDVYVSKNASRALATSTSRDTTVGSLQSSLTVVSPANLSGDTSEAYVIPNGTSRAFTYNGILENKRGTTEASYMQIYAIKYGAKSTDTQSMSIGKIVQLVTPTITLAGNGGNTSAATSTVKVLSPNGGERLQELKLNTIRWSGGDRKVLVGVSDLNGNILGWINLNAVASSSTTWNGYTLTDNRGENVFRVKDKHPGPYRMVAISPDFNGEFDYSDGTFTIASSTSTAVQVQGIKITYPLGVERFYPRSTVEIRWTGAVSGIDNLNIYLIGYRNGIRTTSSMIAQGIPTRTGSYKWTVPAASSTGMYAIELGVTGYSTISRQFTIVAPAQAAGDTISPSQTNTVQPLAPVSSVIYINPPTFSSTYAVGAPLAQKFTILGETSGKIFDWQIVSGSLPPGISLVKEGEISMVLSGYFTRAGGYTFTLRAVDRNNSSVAKNIEMRIVVSEPTTTASPTVTPYYSPSYSPSPTYSSSPSQSTTPSASVSSSPSSSASPSSSSSASPSPSATTSSSPKSTSSSSGSPSGTPVGYAEPARGSFAAVFYALGDLFDNLFAW